MTFAEQLDNSLQRISDLLSSVSDEAWHRPQSGKWTIAQELDHLLTSTQQTALLFSPMGRSRWRAGDRPSRSFESIQEGYITALAANPGVVNTATAPSERVSRLSAAEQLTNWQQTAQTLIANVTGLSDNDLDNFTVWKHPLLGPLTGREMIYFTTYHTLRHEASLRRKQGDV